MDRYPFTSDDCYEEASRAMTFHGAYNDPAEATEALAELLDVDDTVIADRARLVLAGWTVALRLLSGQPAWPGVALPTQAMLTSGTLAPSRLSTDLNGALDAALALSSTALCAEAASVSVASATDYVGRRMTRLLRNSAIERDLHVAAGVERAAMAVGGFDTGSWWELLETDSSTAT